MWLRRAVRTGTPRQVPVVPFPLIISTAES